MKPRHKVTIAVLLMLVLSATVGLLRTGDSSATAPARASQAAKNAAQLVDQSPLTVARKLSELASTPDEQAFSQETLRLADHEVDLAFADALRNAAQHPPPMSAEAREVSARLDKAEQQIKLDQKLMAELQKRSSAAGGSQADALLEQLDLTKAQAELDQDELDDAKQDLQRAGGDTQSKIQRLLDEHEATQHDGSSDSAKSAAAQINYLAPNLYGQFSAWRALRSQIQQLSQSQQQSLAAVKALSAKHDVSEARLRTESTDKKGATQQAALQLKAGTAANPDQGPHLNTAAAISSLKELSEDQKNLADLDKRIQDHQELAAQYANWMALVKTHQDAALHGMIRSALWIVLIVLAVYLAERFLDRLFVDQTSDRPRLRAARVISRLAANIAGLLLILLVCLGVPSQTPTVLGLVGAGLTVALGDFILAFLGWFLLMGRNGIRVGDWVEINGVGGEVVEISLLRTVLLETGNWNDAGHPTGRKVTFVNSFAISGHFFNFSTAGQWLWDELQIMIPDKDNPYPVVANIQKLVTEKNASDARAAEQELQHVARYQRGRPFSAAPAINVRPTGDGVQLVVRYVTRAHERYEVRTRLYDSVVNLLHPQQSIPAPLAAAATSK